MRPMVLALLLVGGCRQVFGIHDPAASDAAARDAPHLDAAVCSMAAVQCIGPDVLQTCSAAGAPAVTESCTWGCIDDTASKLPHCGELQPAGGAVTAADLDDTMALASVTLQSAKIDGSSGTITNGNVVVRSAGLGVIDGIDYELRGQVAVFRFGAIVIAGATLTGPYAIALVAPGQINVPGVIDAQGPCTDKNGGPGGGAGGASHTTGVGSGGGEPGPVAASGGGGGGYGASGGNGGSTAGMVASGGPSFGDASIMTLVGGSGGGAGGSNLGSPHGGGGGGALQLVSNTLLVISGSINAGGCGGIGGQAADGSGGGGGAGGTVLLEAPQIAIAGTIGANGGGGGGGGANGVAGANATAGTGAAQGGNSLDGGGGTGGNAAHPAGSAGGSNPTYSGGGGGGVGRLRFETRTGVIEGSGPTSPTPIAAAAVVE